MAFDGAVFFRFLIAALAAWRVAFLLARERGPWGVFARLRRSAANGPVGGVLACVKCVGVWVAAPLALFVRGDWWELVVTWGALAGVVALIDEWTRSPFEWRSGDEPEQLEGHEPNTADRGGRR